MTHALKTWPQYFELLVKELKTFEIRKDDRPFAPGDTLIIQEYDNEKSEYTGKELEYKIAFILRNAEKFGLKKGYCILSIVKKETEY